MHRGLLVALEGIDGAGTSTQIAPLAAFLRARGRDVVTTAEPSGGPVGVLLRQALQGRPRLDDATLALLFAADRLDHLAREVEPALARGAVVLTD
ncbi:MAG TPA: dTMP kinase, partial [Myxococcota bacterium]|nr:dTMP kinase [Myxococcota bacterium]